MEPTPAQQLATFLRKYDPAVATVARSALARLRKRLPGATELVYDNYNALAIGFGPSARASDVVISIALYPRWVTLFFLHGARLADPKKILKGSGTRVRHIVLHAAADIGSKDIEALISAALKLAGQPFERRRRRKLIIKSVSTKQRPRRPC
jgi:hypothetical protein